MTTTTTIVIFDPTDASHTALLPSFADIHIACIEIDRAIAAFTTPLNRDVVIEFWNEQAKETVDGTKIIFMALVTEDSAGGQQPQLAGYVVLHRPPTGGGPSRGRVEKLLISQDHRRRGVASKLMQALETEAIARGETVLTLDTRQGSPAAESVYPKLGFTQLEMVRNYGASPLDRRLNPGTFFWKQL